MYCHYFFNIKISRTNWTYISLPLLSDETNVYGVECPFQQRGGNRSTRRKTTDLLQVTDKLHHIMLYRVHLACVEFEFATLAVIGTDCIGSHKSNYHTITTTTAL